MKAVAYCANCGTILKTDVPNKYIGLPVECPAGEQHLAAVTKYSGVFWMRVERWLFSLDQRFSPSRYLIREIKSILGFKGDAVLLLYVFFLRSIIIGLALYNADGSKSGSCINFLSGLSATFFYLEIFLANLVAAFINVAPARPLRSVVYLFVGYLQVTMCFAIFYRLFVPTDWMTALYSSVTTASTVGSAFEIVKSDSFQPGKGWPAIFVALQLFSAIFFLSVLVSIVANFSGKLREDPVKLNDLI